MTYQPAEFDKFFKFVLIHILVTMIADSYGLCLGAVLDPIVSFILLKIDSFD